MQKEVLSLKMDVLKKWLRENGVTWSESLAFCVDGCAAGAGVKALSPLAVDDVIATIPKVFFCIL